MRDEQSYDCSGGVGIRRLICEVMFRIILVTKIQYHNYYSQSMSTVTTLVSPCLYCYNTGRPRSVLLQHL